MDPSQEPASTQMAPGHPEKRKATSVSSSQVQKSKKRCCQQGCEAITDYMMYQPIPRTVTPQGVDYIEDLAAAAEYEHPHNRIDNWLEDAYPTELYERYSRSEGYFDYQDDNSQFDRQSHAQSAPTIMVGNHLRPNLRGAACPSYLAGVSGVSTGLSQSEAVGSFDPPTTDTPSRSYGSLVENPRYRDTNLSLNKISLVDSRREFPCQISTLVKSLTPDRVSTPPLPKNAQDNDDLLAMELEASEAKVENFFRDHVVPRSSQSDILWRSDSIMMSKDIVVSKMPKFKISTPIPDMLYGYNRSNAFNPEQQDWIATTGSSACANNEGLLYPFFAVEFKGDGPSSRGSLWVATNQCLGVSTACINIIERLNEKLRNCKHLPIQQVNSKEGEQFHMQKIGTYILQRSNDYRDFYMYVQNIINWGQDVRLPSIKSALDTLIEEGRLAASTESAESATPHTCSLRSCKRQRSDNSGLRWEIKSEVEEAGEDQDLDIEE
ncbi:hypothetical protein ACHAQD_011054 [Fusarium lateritium]